MRLMLRLTIFGFIFLACGLCYWPRSHAACAGGTGSQGCDLVAEALDAASRLKAGMPRADVEKAFTLDGGMSFQDRATYTYRHCRYIKVDVEFQKRDVAPDVQAFSPEDQVSKVSKPYLAYPISD
jgi:hypothetical protein